MVLWVMSLTLILLTCTSRAAQEEVFTPEEIVDLENFIDSLRHCRGIVGGTMAVVKGKETWKRGFGMVDSESFAPVNSSHLFGIGSLTKAFVSALLSQLLDENDKYSWDTPVADILGPNFRLFTEKLTKDVTLKDILTHRTGLDTADLQYSAGFHHQPLAQYAKNMRFLPVKEAFRDEYDYNNWMYGLLGYVIEKLGGSPWEEQLQSRLLGPLYMRDTGVLGTSLDLRDERLAKPFVMVGGQTVASDRDIYNLNAWAAAGSIASSADDMTQWMRLLLNKGRSHEGLHVLSEKRVTQMTSPYTSIPGSTRRRWNLTPPHFPVLYTTDSYGLAWFIGTYGGHPIFWHSGGFYGYTTYMALIPDLGVGVFVTNNGPNGKNASHMNRQIFFYTADILMGKQPWLNTSNACQYPELWKGPSSSSPDPPTVYDNFNFDDLNRFVGRYEHPLFGVIMISVNGTEGLYARYNFMEGRLAKSDTDHVAMWEVVGSMEFEFHQESPRTYPQLNFTRYSNGTYQEVELSIADSSDKPLVFYRPSKVPASGCGGIHITAFNVVISALLSAAVYML